MDIITTTTVIIMIVNLIQMHTEYSALRSVVVANYEETVRYLPCHHHLYLYLDDIILDIMIDILIIIFVNS